MTSLRQRMIEDMQVRNLSPHTQESYVRQVAQFARHFDRSPEELGPVDIRSYQVYLTNEKKLAPGSILIAVAALRFVYRVTLQKEWLFEDIIPAPKKPQTLPVVLSPEEALRFLESVQLLKHRAILTTCYAAGLRVSEAVRLRPTDIDSQRMVIRVEQGKGQKDRYVMLSLQLLQLLRTWWRVGKPKLWLFPGASANSHITTSAVEDACKKAHRLCGIPKPITPHSLRHAFAVHRLLAWYRDGGDVQARLPLLTDYMGHVSLVSTQTYLEITAELLGEATRRFRAPALTASQPPGEI